MVDDSPAESEESDMRRRAAWLLVMLAVVAILFVVLMTSLLGTDGGKHNVSVNGGLDNSLTPSASAPAPTSHHPRRTSSAPNHTKSSSSAPTGTTTCPTSAPCILDSDVGHAVSAINAYRAQHQKSPIPGAVSAAAQTCALHRGNGCSGGWAETELSTPDGVAAVAKIQQFAKLLDPQMKSIGVGWAYNPGSKTYYFVTIRQN